MSDKLPQRLLPVWMTGFRYRFEFADVICVRPLLASLPLAKRFVEGLSGAPIDAARVRLKHAYEWTDAKGEHLCFVNARHDITKSGWGSIGYILKINYDTGEISKVFHGDIVEDRAFSGAVDPRYFWRSDQLGVIFNAPCRDGNRRMFIYFEHLNQCIKLQISGFPLSQEEKNWTVMVVGDVIYIIYTFNPSIVFRLDDDKTGFCSLASEHPFIFSNPIEPLYPYGGSSLCLWSYPYFVGLGHTRGGKFVMGHEEFIRTAGEGAVSHLAGSHVPPEPFFLPFRSAFILFNAEEKRVEAVGEPFAVPQPKQAVKWRGADVEYPYHLDFSGGRCEAWIECQDRCPTKYQFNFIRFCEIVSTLIVLKPRF